MNVSEQIAKHFKEIYFGGNWTCVNLRDTLSDVSWQQATTKVVSFNTIATLVYHINYYVAAVTKVLQGGLLDAHDTLSFNHPPIESDEDWQVLLTTVWADAEVFATLIAQLPVDTLWQNLSEEKYGIYYRNLHGIIEHAHYHLGQIVLIKKLLQQAV
jgi:hypothetical protein